MSILKQSNTFIMLQLQKLIHINSYLQSKFRKQTFLNNGIIAVPKRSQVQQNL